MFTHVVCGELHGLVLSIKGAEGSVGSLSFESPGVAFVIQVIVVHKSDGRGI